MTDQQYCSSTHRHEARLASAQALRDEDEMESWTVEKSRNKKKSSGLPSKSAGQTASIFAFLTVAGLLVTALMLPGPTTSYPPAVSLDPGVKAGILERASGAISEVIRSSAPVTLHQDLHSGFGDWATLALRNTVDDPRIALTAPDLSKLGSLRLWTKSIGLQNYQMEFQGQVERRSLSWAVRASDQNNYYATRLVITKPGPSPNASLIHYTIMNGREYDPLTEATQVTLEKGKNYRVRVSVQDDRFSTYLDGQLIGHWIDKRLNRGGVGFFVDEQDPQEVAWVNVSERDSFLGRMLAHFSLLVVPPGLSPDLP
ncbi:MAG TPA: hypothetical protein VGG72_26375 [Bryobacteraceae bacterium]